MGMVNAAVPHDDLERTAIEWARLVNEKSPTAQRMLKFSFNLIDDGLVGQQIFAGEATRLAYMTDEAQEGRDAFLEKRPMNFKTFPGTTEHILFRINRKNFHALFHLFHVQRCILIGWIDGGESNTLTT